MNTIKAKTNKVQNINFEVFLDSTNDALNTNEKMLKVAFTKISNLYYHLKFEEIIALVTELLPEFWIKHPELQFLMVKFHFFELIKSGHIEDAYDIHQKERKSTVFNYILNRVDLMRSNFYINKAEFYFQLFLEKFQIEAKNYYLGLENFYYTIKVKEIDSKISLIEDIEDDLYSNALNLVTNFPIQVEFTESNCFNVFDDQNEENILAAIPPTQKTNKKNLIKVQEYNSYTGSIFPTHNDHNDYMDLDDIDICSKQGDFMTECSVINGEISSSSKNHSSTQIFEITKTQRIHSTNLANINFKEKVRIPYLKKFNPKSIKREEIDKKIIRKFKKYLKDKMRSKSFLHHFAGLSFWKDFTTNNLLPPMVYKENNEEIEFKSFNSNFIVWLFSKNEAKNLYNKFLDDNKDELLESLKQMIKVTITDDIIIELTNIFEYVQCFADIYSVYTVSSNDIDVSKTYKNETNDINESCFEKNDVNNTNTKNNDVESSPNVEMFSKNNDTYAFFEDKEIGDSCCFQNIDFFKTMDMNLKKRESFNPFDDHSDDDFGKMMNPETFSGRNSFI